MVFTVSEGKIRFMDFHKTEKMVITAPSVKLFGRI